MSRVLLNKLLDGATAHGKKSEPDHEVGDLQDILRSCWDYLAESHKQAIYDKHKNICEDWIDGEPS